jgi:phosphonate transport system permease protein
MAASASSDRLHALRLEADRLAGLERTRNLGIALVLLVLAYVTAHQTEVSPEKFFKGAFNMLRVLEGFLHPNLSIVLPKAFAGSTEYGNVHGFPEGLVGHFALETLAIAVIGTLLGTLVAIPVSFLAARNLMRVNPAGTAVYFLVRSLMSIVRSIPTLFWGLLFVTAISVGPFAGVMAVAIFSFGLMSKLFSEAIEAIDWGQIEALTATGANPVQVVAHGVVPQVMPYMIAHLLYTFEVNVHSATILGIIGAGGIGFLFNQYIDTLDYPATAMLLYVVIPMTMVIDYSSAAIRRRII